MLVLSLCVIGLSSLSFGALAETETVKTITPVQKTPELEPTMAEYQEWLKKNGHPKKDPSPPPPVLTNSNLQKPKRVISRQEELVIPARVSIF